MINVVAKLLGSGILILLLNLPAATVAKSPGAARLIVMGTVLINDTWVTDNITCFSPSRISTTPGTLATIDCGQAGRLFLTENSAIQLTFSDQALHVTLNKGELRVQSANPTVLTITTNTDPLVEVINGTLQITARASQEKSQEKSSKADKKVAAPSKVATVAVNSTINSLTNPTVSLVKGERFIGKGLGAMQLQSTTGVDCRVGLGDVTPNTKNLTTIPTVIPLTVIPLPVIIFAPNSQATAAVSRILAASDDNVTPSGPITPTGR
jgi:hypothetical protein